MSPGSFQLSPRGGRGELDDLLSFHTPILLPDPTPASPIT
jgi:hypothetical protein